MDMLCGEKPITPVHLHTAVQVSSTCRGDSLDKGPLKHTTLLPQPRGKHNKQQQKQIVKTFKHTTLDTFKDTRETTMATCRF